MYTVSDKSAAAKTAVKEVSKSTYLGKCASSFFNIAFLVSQYRLKHYTFAVIQVYIETSL